MIETYASKAIRGELAQENLPKIWQLKAADLLADLLFTSPVDDIIEDLPPSTQEALEDLMAELPRSLENQADAIHARLDALFERSLLARRQRCRIAGPIPVQNGSPCAPSDAFGGEPAWSLAALRPWQSWLVENSDGANNISYHVTHQAFQLRRMTSCIVNASAISQTCLQWLNRHYIPRFRVQ